MIFKVVSLIGDNFWFPLCQALKEEESAERIIANTVLFKRDVNHPPWNGKWSSRNSILLFKHLGASAAAKGP